MSLFEMVNFPILAQENITCIRCSVVVYVNGTRKGMVEGTEPQGFGYTSFILKSYY